MHDHEVTECICTDLLSFRCAWHFSFFFFVCVCVCEKLAAHFSDSLLSFLYASWNLNNEINRKDKTEAIWSAHMLKPKSMGQTRFRATEEMENYFFHFAISRVTFQCTLYNNIIHQITYLFVIIITILSSYTLCVWNVTELRVLRARGAQKKRSRWVLCLLFSLAHCKYCVSLYIGL